MRFTLRQTLLAVFLLLPGLAAAAEELVVGVLAYRGEGRALARWSSTMEQLERAIPSRRFVLRPLTLDGMRQAVAAGEVDFVLTNPGQYGLLAPRYGLSHLATHRVPSRSARAATGSVLLVQRDSPYRSAEQLRGRQVAAIHPKAFGGFLLLRAALAEQGLDVEEAFRLRFLGFPVDAAVYRLAGGEVEAAIVPACLLEQMAAEGLVEPGAFRALGRRTEVEDCLSSTRLYPAWSFAAMPQVPETLASAVAAALLQFEESAQGGWGAPVSPAAVEMLLRDLQLHPLQRGLPQQLRDWLAAHSGYVALLSGFAVLLALYHLWLHRLAGRRARALEAAQRRLRERDRQLAAAQHLSVLGELAAALAHELNQPLAAIRHYADGALVRLRRQAPDHEVLPALERIERQAGRAGEVIQALRRSLRREPGPRQQVVLREVLADVLELQRDQLARQGVEVRVELPPGLRVRAQRVALEQVLHNLLGNSLQAYAARAQAGTIVISAAADGGDTTIRLRDEAGGFPADRLEQPFEPLRSSRAEGLGMGLLICQRLMAAQHGAMELRNTERGAEVLLRLPGEER